MVVIRNGSLKTDAMMRNFGWPIYLVWGQLYSSENKGSVSGLLAIWKLS